MCTLGDAADVNPVIKSLRHALQRVSQELDITDWAYKDTNDMILNSNTRDGLQALRQMNGLCPAQTLRVGTEHIGRAGGR